MLPHRGQLHNLYEKAVSSILFHPLPGAPNLPFIKFVLAGLGLISLGVGVGVWNDSTRGPSPASVPLDKQLMIQAKIWRNQRNLYLTCLALALWYAVYVTFSYKVKIARLLEQIEGGGNGGAATAADRAPAAVRAPAPSSASAAGGASSSSKPKPKELQPEEHLIADKREGQPLVQRKLPKPSAPELE